MTVSVVVPLYNKGPYVRRALDSILAQTVPAYEVLVVDDGSTDDGPSLIASCPDSRVRLIRQANQGPGRARNRGLQETTQPLVAFLDADDEWLPTFLEKSLAVLQRHGPEVACVSSGYLQHPSGRSTEPMWRKRGLTEGPVHLDASADPQWVVYLLAYLSPWNTLVRTETVRRWGGFFDRDKCLYGEDSFLWLKVLLNETVALTLEPLVRFHTEASALSKNRQGPRPVEPLLLYPADLEAACPEHLKGLLQEVLALRAMKTACMLGYWGKWREGRQLLRQFCPGGFGRWPRVEFSKLCASPLGAGVASAWRLVRGQRERTA